VTGASLFIASAMIAGACLKAADPAGFGRSLVLIFPRRWWRLRPLTPIGCARAIVAAELITGVILLVGSGRLAVVGTSVSVGLCAAFLVAIAAAVGKGVSCGCFGSVSRDGAGAAELARGVILLVVALGLWATRIGVSTRAPAITLGGGAAGLVLVAFGVIAATIAGRWPGHWTGQRPHGGPGLRQSLATGLGVSSGVIRTRPSVPDRSRGSHAVQVDYVRPTIAVDLAAAAARDALVAFASADPNLASLLAELGHDELPPGLAGAAAARVDAGAADGGWPGLAFVLLALPLDRHGLLVWSPDAVGSPLAFACSERGLLIATGGTVEARGAGAVSSLAQRDDEPALSWIGTVAELTLEVCCGQLGHAASCAALSQAARQQPSLVGS
jgi:hypothetical protein